MPEGVDKSIQVTADELLVINNSINEVLHGPDAIKGWEFQTRMGVDREFAKQVLARISAIVKAQ